MDNLSYFQIKIIIFILLFLIVYNSIKKNNFREKSNFKLSILKTLVLPEKEPENSHILREVNIWHGKYKFNTKWTVFYEFVIYRIFIIFQLNLFIDIKRLIIIRILYYFPILEKLEYLELYKIRDKWEKIRNLYNLNESSFYM